MNFYYLLTHPDSECKELSVKLLRSLSRNMARKAVVYSLQNLLSNQTIQAEDWKETDLGIILLLTDQFAF